MLRIASGAVVLALVAGPALAQVDDGALAGCDGPTDEMADCVEALYEESEDQLNAVWQQVLESINPSRQVPAEFVEQWRNQIIAAQNSWYTFRREDCSGALRFEQLGGAGTRLAVVTCLYDETSSRIDDLRRRYLDAR